MSTSWGTSSAEQYAQYCQSHDTYQATSAHLVNSVAKHADAPLNIVDLACGTGVVALEILRQFGSAVNLTCIDQSPEMLVIAQQEPQLHNARFFHYPAEEIDQLGLPSIDIIVCNSAFWLMNMPLTLRIAAQVLKKEGLFAFSIPGYLVQDSSDNSLLGNNPRLMEAMIDANLQHSDQRKPPTSKFAISEEAIERMATRSGYSLIDLQQFDLDEAIATTYDALRIPALLERYAPDVAPEDRQALLLKLSQQLTNTPTSVRWFSYILRRN